jgi:hypothetical protein
MSECRKRVNADLAPKLADMRSRLEALRTAKHHQLDLDFEDAVGIRLRQKQTKERKLERIFAEYAEYVQDTLTTEDAAFLRVAAVFKGE